VRRYLEIGRNNGRISEEWDNLDICRINETEVGIVADITKPLPIPDERYEIVYMSHVLEHVPWFQTVEVLREIRRVIVPGGRIEIFVPDLLKILSGPMDDWRDEDMREDHFMWANGRVFRGIRGGAEHEWHRAMFTPNHLKNCLEWAGFHDTEILTQVRAQDHGIINLGMSAIK
jgi:predicted SAM-dependent methyltransferase